jgi:inner membrane protein
MDPFSQASLGAVVGQAAGFRQLGFKATVIGAVAGALPDIDVLFSIGGDFIDQLVTHRGITHSLFFVAVAGPALGWLVWYHERWRDPGVDPTRRARWMLVVSLALLSHPLLDLCTSYGTQLLLPFSNARLAIDAMPIIDPLYTGLLGLGLLVGWLWARSSRADPAAIALLTLLASSSYLIYGWTQGIRAEQAARDQLTDQGIEITRIAAFPTLLQTHLRRVVARSATVDRVGFYSTWEPCQISWMEAPRSVPTAYQSFLATREGRVFHWFTMGWGHYQVDQRPGSSHHRIIASDLRYGFEDAPLSSLFTLEAWLGPGGQLAAVAQAGRAIPADTGNAIARLLQSTYAPACRLLGARGGNPPSEREMNDNEPDGPDRGVGETDASP